MISKQEVYDILRKKIKCQNNKEDYSQLLYFTEQDVIEVIPKDYKPKIGDWVLGRSGSGPNTTIIFQWTEAQENTEDINCLKFEPFNGILPSWIINE